MSNVILGSTPIKVEEDTTTSKIELTEFEDKVVLPKLTCCDDDWVITKELSKADIYGINLYEDEDWTKTRFISLRGFFTNSIGIKLHVSIVVINDSRFYLSLGNKEIKKRIGQDAFVNYIPHMIAIIEAMSSSIMTPEDIEAELSLIDTFGQE